MDKASLQPNPAGYRSVIPFVIVCGAAAFEFLRACSAPSSRRDARLRRHVRPRDARDCGGDVRPGYNNGRGPPCFDRNAGGVLQCNPQNPAHRESREDKE